MPAQPITYPSERPIPFTLDAGAVQAAVTALSVGDAEHLRVALHTAQQHLAGHAQLALDNGRLLLTSPRSNNRYTCTRFRCECEAGKFSRLCWHRAAAAIVRWIWDRAKPLVRCPHCAGPMVASTTYGGERSVSCLVCHHELPLVAVEALGLSAWHERPHDQGSQGAGSPHTAPAARRRARSLS